MTVQHLKNAFAIFRRTVKKRAYLIALKTSAIKNIYCWLLLIDLLERFNVYLNTNNEHFYNCPSVKV